MGNTSGGCTSSLDSVSSNLSPFLTAEHRKLIGEILGRNYLSDSKSEGDHKKHFYKLISKAVQQKWSYVCIHDIISKNQSSFSCSLVKQKEDKSTQQHSLGKSCLRQNLFLSAGLLTCQPLASSSGGIVYFSDTTGAIPCVLGPNVAHDMIGEIIIPTRFNYIVLSASLKSSLPDSLRQPKMSYCPYLEVDTVLVCRHNWGPRSLQEQRLSGGCLTVRGFSGIPRSDIRKAGKDKCNFSICGRVTAISPVITRDQVMFVQLSDLEEPLHCEVVVQVPSLLHLMHTLHLWKCYTFTCLQIRMMSVENCEDPSESTERRVLCATASTQIIQHEREVSRENPSEEEPAPSLTTASFIQSLLPEGSSREGRKRGRLEQTKITAGTRKKIKSSASVSEWLGAVEEAPAIISAPSGRDQKESSPTHLAPSEESETSMDSSVVDSGVRREKRGLTGRHFISYKGTITKCIFPEAGVFELDSTIRLCLCHTASHGGTLALREGAELEVYNAHLAIISGLRLKVLTVCALSCIRVVKFSHVDPCGTYLPFIPRRFPLFGYSQKLSGPVLVWVLQVYLDYRDRFSSSKICSWDKPSSLQSSFEGLLSFLLVHVSRIKRRYLCEVFSSPHLCHCPLRSTWMPPYRILFPGEVWTLLMEKVKVGGWRDGQGAVLMKESSVSEKDYPQWKYFQFDSNHHLDPPLLLVGVVDGHKRRGTLVLSDKEYSLELVVVSDSSGPPLQRGQLVAVTHFTAVTEHLELESGPLLAGKKQTTTIVHTCVCAYRRNIEVCYPPREQTVSGSHGDDHHGGSCHGDSCHEVHHTVLSKSGESSSNDTKGKKVHPSVGTVDLVSTSQSSHQVSLSSEKPPLKLSHAVDCSSASSNILYCYLQEKFSLALETPSGGKKGALQFSFSVEMAAFPDLCSLEDFLSCCSDTAKSFTHHPREFLLTFSGDMIKYHHFVSKGSAYILTTPKPLFGKSSFQKMPAFKFCENMEIQSLDLGESLPLTSPIQEQLDRVRDLQPVLDWHARPYPQLPSVGSQQQKQQVVSFKGVVVSRLYKVDQKGRDASIQEDSVNNVKIGPHFTTLAVCNELKICPAYCTHELELKVTDLSSPDHLTVYCRIVGQSQPSWILPRMRVRFRNFVYEKSHKYDNVYCKYSPQSEMELIGLMDPSEMQSDRVCDVNTRKFSLPLSSLYNLMLDFANLKLKQSSVLLLGNVTYCQSVSFRHVCSHCNLAITDNVCRPTCVGPVGMVKVEARCMFSDGSGEVVMFCDGDLVKTVLNLSQLDWCAFKEVAEKTGQLLYKRPSVFLVQEDKKQRDEVQPTSTHSLTTADILAEKATASTVHRYIKIVARPFVPTSSLLLPGDPQTRVLHLPGTQVNTLNLPKLHLRLLSVDTVMYTQDTSLLLQKN